MENIWRNLFSDKNRCLAIMARRAALESALSGVRLSYPAVPQLREFQVTVRPFDTRYFSYSPCNFFPTTYSSDGHLGERSGYW